VRLLLRLLHDQADSTREAGLISPDAGVDEFVAQFLEFRQGQLVQDHQRLLQDDGVVFVFE